MKSIKDIRYIWYINLLSRPDRKQHVETQLSSIGVFGTRFDAIKMKNGAIGCSMSHLKILQNAKQNNLDHVMIVEDDILFTNPSLFVTQINNVLTNHNDFDVLLIAGNNMPPYSIIDKSCVKVTRCQTTTGYLVKNHYYDTLIQNYKDGILHLIKKPSLHTMYAIDKYWFNLQIKDKWYLITPLTVTQREDYSDIEKRQTNYTRAMLDLDKVEFMKRQQELIMRRGN